MIITDTSIQVCPILASAHFKIKYLKNHNVIGPVIPKETSMDNDEK